MRPFVALFAALFLVPLVPGQAYAQPPDIPPQEPGVTMRVFDVQVPLEDFCTLKPGQTPNIDQLKPTIDWTTAEDFGMGENFVTEVTGYLNIQTPGKYNFRLTSDDGSRLIVDGTEIIDNGGKHGPQPKDGSVELAEGITRCASTTGTAPSPSASCWSGSRRVRPGSPACPLPR